MQTRPVAPEGLEQAHRTIAEYFVRHPEQKPIREAFGCAFETLVECFRQNGTLFLCGNGGSFADCQHISGELMKTFERKRPLPEDFREKLLQDPVGTTLADELQSGFRSIPLGLSASLVSAIWNDSPTPNIHYAQELTVLGRPGDVLLAISTSGRARNVLNAMAVARALGLPVIALTGPDGGDVARQADIALRLPGARTCEIQEAHLPCYHLLCLTVEQAFFTEARG
jgi:D-sedoheptulose 7-phosphate isomerase